MTKTCTMLFFCEGKLAAVVLGRESAEVLREKSIYK